ncbi:MAG: hypothetical protein BM564_13070 [Bacteroidetes bacterium MedPE-SWsnd-G2]|nr:MAG: hypothetical protein BM564_13070 [Bacteroidetes bacterium MedPE-SWsnd-G2]
MNLYTYCKSCKNNIKINSQAPTRPELQMEMGDTFKVNCKHCDKWDKAHINDVKAEQSKHILLLGLILGVIFTLFIWTYYSSLALVSFIIPLLVWKQQLMAVKAFNGYMIKRKIS